MRQNFRCYGFIPVLFITIVFISSCASMKKVEIEGEASLPVLVSYDKAFAYAQMEKGRKLIRISMKKPYVLNDNIELIRMNMLGFYPDYPLNNAELNGKEEEFEFSNWEEEKD